MGLTAEETALAIDLFLRATQLVATLMRGPWLVLGLFKEYVTVMGGQVAVRFEPG